MDWYNKKRKKLILVLLAIATAVALVVISATVASAARRRKSRSRSSSSPFASSSFGVNYDITWASDHVRISGQGQQQLDLMLNEASGAGFGSKNRYLFGNLGMQIRLVQNDSAGTVVAYYMSSLTDDREEFAFQFLGNSTGQPYTLQTNVFVKGVGGREQRLFLWFDPTADFHSYSLVWNQHQVIFMVDNIPIRVLKTKSNDGVVYVSSKPMGIYTSIWAGGLAGSSTVNWQHAPFIVSYLNNFSLDACQYSEQSPENCLQANNNKWWSSLEWNNELQGNLTLVKRNFLTYDYCKDTSRYPTVPQECMLTSS